MSEYTWVPVMRQAQRRFASPRFTELTPLSRSGGRGNSGGIMQVAPFDRAVLSWNGEGNWKLEMSLLLSGGGSTPYFVLGVIDGTRQRSARATEKPGTELAVMPLTDSSALPPPLSLPQPVPSPVSLAVDTLVLKNGVKANGFQVRATGEGELRSLCVAHYRRDENRYTDRPAVRGAWGVTLPVPERAQRDVEEEKHIGGEVCSPTSLGMVLEYHGTRLRTIDIARAAYDEASKLYGNWPCNTGAAARLLKGGRGWSAVVKMTGFDEVEREIAARRPVIISHRWQAGDLTGAPVSRSNGHLIVIVGFTKDGDVVVNDPAARAGQVRRVYRRRELFRTWQMRGEGIAYLVHPS